MIVLRPVGRRTTVGRRTRGPLPYYQSSTSDRSLKDDDSAALKGHRGAHEFPRTVGAAVTGLRGRVCGRGNRPGARRHGRRRPLAHPAAQPRVVGGGGIERCGCGAARAGTGVRPPQPGAAARCADDRLRPADGCPLRTPPGRGDCLARRDHDDGRPCGSARAHRQRRVTHAGRAGAVHARDRDVRCGGAAPRGFEGHAEAGGTEHGAGRGGGCRVRYRLRVHEDGGDGMDVGCRGRGTALARGDRGAGRGRTVAVPGRVPGRQASPLRSRR